jgi:hypothetical protein
VYIGTIATHECGLSFNRKITTTNVFWSLDPCNVFPWKWI